MGDIPQSGMGAHIRNVIAFNGERPADCDLGRYRWPVQSRGGGLRVQML